MKVNKFVCFVILFLFTGPLFGNNVFADEPPNIKISYKILESQSDDHTLAMVVKLRVKNTASFPIYSVKVTNTYMKNVTINSKLINMGNIGAGQTALSADSFTIIMNVESTNQEAPQMEAVWLVEYYDAVENPVIEEIVLR